MLPYYCLNYALIVFYKIIMKKLKHYFRLIKYYLILKVIKTKNFDNRNDKRIDKFIQYQVWYNYYKRLLNK